MRAGGEGKGKGMAITCVRYYPVPPLGHADAEVTIMRSACEYPRAIRSRR